jgi:transcriptional regulator with XRE-family HTH domain
VSEDWASVAKAISQRLTELGMRQRELAERSHVSQAIIRELQHNTVQRRRSARTLEALSLALGWHPDHLTAVLRGLPPPEPGDPPLPATDEDVPARLAVIEHHLRQITNQLGVIDEINGQLDELNANLSAVIRRTER